jgi:hypothetical protein
VANETKTQGRIHSRKESESQDMYVVTWHGLILTPSKYGKDGFAKKMCAFLNALEEIGIDEGKFTYHKEGRLVGDTAFLEFPESKSARRKSNG